MNRRSFLASLLAAVVGAGLFGGRRVATEDPDELVLVNGWIVKRSQAPEGRWRPAP